MAKVVHADFTRKTRRNVHKSSDKPISAYQFKISLPFSDPLIWRRIVVAGQTSLARFHHIIQACMGWHDEDTHQFMVGKIFYQSGFGIKEMQERDADYDEARFSLHDLEEAMGFIFTYLYDGGDGWEVEITLEEILPPFPDDYELPRLVAGERAAPPEAAGDIHRYQALVHDSEGSITIGDLTFNPAAFDHDGCGRRLAEAAGM
jgi:hypothetical protein